MKLHNLMEDEVIRIINELLKDREDMCTCDKCKLDIAAITLNNLKPKYVVTEKGGLFAKVEILNCQFDVDLIKEVTKAAKIVGDEPQHE